MISWEEYVKSNILEFRKRYEKIPNDARKLIEEKRGSYGHSLAKPCQVVVVNLTDRPQKSFIIANCKERPDMEIIVLGVSGVEDFVDKSPKEPRLKALFSPEIIGDITDSMWDTFRKKDWISVTISASNYQLYSTAEDPRSSPYDIANHFFLDVESSIRSLDRDKQKKKIEATVDNLKRDAKAIPETIALRNKIIENTRRLDKQIKGLNKKVEEDFSAIRKLVGTSKEFLDWKVFSTDVKHLKETHLAKDVFDFQIRRLDEKIEKGLDALNTRIEDLKAIKFWSKRTVLEIALTIWGTIVTLYAAGILEF